MKTYKTFVRSARNFEEFAKARKITRDRGLTESDARERCRKFNDNRNAAQIRKGTKLEFTEES